MAKKSIDNTQIKTVIAPAEGINKYLPSHLIKDKAWSDGNNIHFGSGYLEKCQGWYKLITTPSAWAASTAYVIGNLVSKSTHVYRCTTAGTSGLTEPAFNATAGATYTDNTVVWTEVGATVMTGTVMAMDNFYKFSGDDYLMAVTTTHVYYYQPLYNTWVDITGETPLTGTTSYPVITENATDYFIFTNGVNNVKYWNGTGNIADLAGMTDALGGVTSLQAKVLLYFANCLMLGHTTENGTLCPQRIRTSQIGNIEKWKNNDDGSGDVFWGDLTDEISGIKRILPISNYIVAYKENSIQILSYVGGSIVWDKRPVIIDKGLIAPRAIVNLGDKHMFVSSDNIYTFNLVETQAVGDAITNHFFDILDPDKTNLITGFYLKEVPEVWFTFVSTASADGLPDKAIVYNTDTKAWSMRDMPMTAFGYYNMQIDDIWADDEQTWDSDDTIWDSSTRNLNASMNVCGDTNGIAYVLDGNAKDTSDLSCYVRTKLFDFDNPFQLKRIKRIQFMISHEGDYNLKVRVGTSHNVGEEIVWGDPYYMSLNNSSLPWVDIDVTARYMMFEFSTSLKEQPFKLTGYSLYYDIRGQI